MKAYHLFDIANKFFMLQGVVFHETIFPFHKVTSSDKQPTFGIDMSTHLPTSFSCPTIISERQTVCPSINIDNNPSPCIQNANPIMLNQSSLETSPVSKHSTSEFFLVSNQPAILVSHNITHRNEIFAPISRSSTLSFRKL